MEAEASTWALPGLCREDPGFEASALAAEEPLEFETLFARAAEGDRVARSVRDRCLRVWAAGAVSMVHAWDPEVLVVGGGVMRNAAAVLPAIRGARAPPRVDALGPGRGPGGGPRRAGRPPGRGAAAAGGVRARSGTPRQLRQAAVRPRRPPVGLPRGLDGHHSSACRACAPGPGASWPSSATRACGWTRLGGRFTEGLAPTLVVDVRQAYRHAADVERMCAPLSRRRPGVRPHERARARRLPRPGPRGDPPLAHRQGRGRPRPRGGGRRQPPGRARRRWSTRTWPAGRSSSASGGRRSPSVAVDDHAEQPGSSSTSGASSSTGARPTA